MSEELMMTTPQSIRAEHSCCCCRCGLSSSLQEPRRAGQPDQQGQVQAHRGAKQQVMADR